jgi:hypothetical protein
MTVGLRRDMDEPRGHSAIRRPGEKRIVACAERSRVHDSLAQFARLPVVFAVGFSRLPEFGEVAPSPAAPPRLCPRPAAA